MMQGLPGNIFTDQRGYYRAKLPYGWSGTVRPFKRGYTFSPPELVYSKVVADCTDGNYAATPESSEAASSGQYGSFGSSRSRGRSDSEYRSTIRSGGRKVLVIPAGEINAKELAETIEDMHVMSHILDEGFKKTRRIQGFFTDFGDFFGRDSRSAEATYLQGFGVLFLMEVNFAFSPPPKKQAQDPTETSEAGDSTWQKAKRQVLSPGISPGSGEEDLADDYDNQMVKELKKELVNALKHASNIRNIEPDEWVILTVLGGGQQSGGVFGGGGFMMGGMGGGMGGGYGVYGGSSGYKSGGMMGGMGGGMMGGMEGRMMGGGMGGGMGGMSSPGEMGVSPATVLTIRAAKCDVDAFAKGEQDYEQFRQKVQILTY
jgi:hypothetical protein